MFPPSVLLSREFGLALAADPVPGAGVGGVTSEHFAGTRGVPPTPAPLPPPLHRGAHMGSREMKGVFFPLPRHPLPLTAQTWQGGRLEDRTGIRPDRLLTYQLLLKLQGHPVRSKPRIQSASETLSPRGHPSSLQFSYPE